ncbi:MAG: universal stress protein [Verrucomicrobiae bacterium]|nr:universal stress protein [Verrucomicrobiae bacterium]
MYRHILIATDGSAVAGKAVEHGLQLAKSCGAKVTGVMATEMWSALDVAGPGGLSRIEAYEAAATHAAKSVLDGFAEAARKHGVAAETLHVPDTEPAKGIIWSAEKLGCDLIVVGSHGRRGIERLLLGSQTQGVITNAKCPVLVCR